MDVKHVTHDAAAHVHSSFSPLCRGLHLVCQSPTLSALTNIRHPSSHLPPPPLPPASRIPLQVPQLHLPTSFFAVPLAVDLSKPSHIPSPLCAFRLTQFLSSTAAFAVSVISKGLQHIRPLLPMAIAYQPRLPVFDSKSEPPVWLSDGATRLYICLNCPFAQRAWTARNFKGLENVELVPIELKDKKPTWYPEKVYPAGKVPSLQHNGKVTGESLDLLEYFEKNFEGPSIFPAGSAKKAATKELLKYSNELVEKTTKILKNKEATKILVEETLDPVFNHIEASLAKFSDEGPYFLGAISAVDIAYAPFIERYQLLLPNYSNYDPLKGRSKLTQWVEAMNTVDAYTSTKQDPDVNLSFMKRALGL